MCVKRNQTNLLGQLNIQNSAIRSKVWFLLPLVMVVPFGCFVIVSLAFRMNSTLELVNQCFANVMYL